MKVEKVWRSVSLTWMIIIIRVLVTALLSGRVGTPFAHMREEAPPEEKHKRVDDET